MNRELSSRVALSFAALAALVFACGIALGSLAYANELPSDSLTVADAPDANDDSQNDADDEAAREAEEAARLARKTLADGLYNIGSVSNPSLLVMTKDGLKRAGATAIAATKDELNWSQKWAISWDGEKGYYRIRNLNSRKCLGVSGQAKKGAAVRQLNYSRSARQLWEPIRVSGKIVFKLAGTDLALTMTGKTRSTLKLTKLSAITQKAQRFRLTTVKALETDQTYFIRNVATGKRLRIARDSRANGTRLTVASAAASKGQKFRLLKSGSAFRMQNVRSCYYVGTNARGSGNARQISVKNGNRSRWKIKLDYRAAAFSIISKTSGKCLDASTRNVRLKKRSGEKSQLFTFSKTYAFKLYLNPGHGRNSNGNGAWDSGAVGSGYEEAVFTHDLCRRVESLLADSDVKVINGEKYHLAFWRRMPKAVSLGCDAIVSVHFDAGGGSGTLKMVGVQGRAAGSDDLANIIQRNVVSRLGLPDRGRVTRRDITCVNGAIPSMLVEVCFMDNYHDVHTYLRKRNAVAAGLAKGIKQASRNRKIVR